MSLDMMLTDKLEPFMFKDKRFKVAFGGRGGTKSNTVVDILLHKVHTKGLKVGCLREHQNTIEDSVHSLVEDEISRIGIPGFDVQKATIEHANQGKFRFKGLARNIEGIKSFNGFDIFWVEEAQFISKKSLKLLTPTLRADNSECWLTFNPMSRMDPVSQRFIMPFIKELRRTGVYEDALHYIVWTNWDENPWMPETLNDERKLDYKMLPRNEYDHVWGGHFNDSIENAIILAEWFDSCVDAHKKLKFDAIGKEIVSHDPSDSGYDDKGLVHRHGSVVKQARLSKISDVNDGLDWALDYAVSNRVDCFNWDADGMGLSLKRQVKIALENEEIDYEPFRGSEGVDNPKEVFEEGGMKQVKDKRKQRTNKQALKNKRAQYYWLLRNRVYLTHLAVTHPEYRKTNPDLLISFDEGIDELEQLRAEVCKIPRKPNPNGTIQIANKKDMAQMEIDSPNLADPTMMSLCLPTQRPKTKTVKYTNPWKK